MGLEQGGATSGTLGKMTLSQMGINNDNVDGWRDSGWSIINKLQEGAFFKWKDDLSYNNDIFKVVSVYQPTGSAIRNHASLVSSYGSSDPDAFGFYVQNNADGINYLRYVSTSGSQCQPCYQDFDNDNGFYSRSCFRATRIIEFRKIDQSTGEVLEDGLDPSTFDPRSFVKHDGTSEIALVVVAQARSAGSVFVPEKHRAIWETEPKKSAELDIYYEASSSIPMELNTSNIDSYIPLGSKTSFLTPTFINENNLNLIDPGSPYDITSVDRHYVADTKSFVSDRLKPIINIKCLDGGDNVLDASNGIFINDAVTFTRPDGIITNSRILGHQTAWGMKSLEASTIATALEVGVVDILTGNAISNSENNISTTTEFNISSGMQLTGAMIPSSVLDALSAQAIIFPALVPVITALIELIDGLGGADTPLPVPNAVFVMNYGFLNELQLSDTSWMLESIPYQLTFQKITGWFEIDDKTWRYPIQLGWHNCWAYGNGLESDRIRDDFNAPQLDNGNKASTTIAKYGEEKRKSGLIYSGIYNSNSGVNNLNEFNMAEKITKDVNPVYGSIQALKTRDTDVVVFTEDKVLKVLSNKDAVFNADGNPQLTATDKVLGQTIPFVGDYGISQNPESLAVDQFRMYFTDKQRGAVLRLSRDGLTPISDVGMKTWFSTNLPTSGVVLGSFDKVSSDYNITLTSSADASLQTTLSFNERSKGWVSFKSFIPTAALSVSGKYIATHKNFVYKHYSPSSTRNTFYDISSPTPSVFHVLFNDLPSIVKSFTAIDYEGSPAKIDQNFQDSKYSNLVSRNGWYVDLLKTDVEHGTTYDFIKKENKWFSKICGQTIEETGILDTSDFTFQGLGFPMQVPAIVITSGNGDNGDGNGDGEGEPCDCGDGTVSLACCDDDSNGSEGENTVPVTLTIRNNPEH